MIGTVINERYRVLERIWSNRPADAYLAKDLQTSRLVVVTLIPPAWAAVAGFPQRLRRGARLLGKLDSPYAARLLDFGETGGTHFIVQEHVAGRTLEQFLQGEGRLDLERTLCLMRQVAQCLADVGELGLFHGDLQPAKIVVTKDEIVKVVDFGLSIVRDWAQTGAGLSESPPSAYQSPETVRGQAASIQSDVYALGVSLFELLVGHPPDLDILSADPAALRGELDACLGAILPASSLANNVPRSVSLLIAGCIALDADKRYSPAKVVATIADLFGVEPLAAGQEDNLVGLSLGQYQLLEVIESGGMAAVYKAYQADLDRYVAVKVLSRNLCLNPDGTARFHREAHAVARLDHPNILPVYDVGQVNGLSYIVMKYVPGGTLKDKLGHPMPLPKAVEIVSQTASALDHAHQHGVIHRDVKPSNVLVASDHWVVLSDFGLARVMDSHTRITRIGESIGTPAYISPEQGQGLPADARSDVYSLGVTLYEMLTGQVPYDAETPMAVVIKHISAALPRPREVNPDISEPVEQVVLKALAKNPDERYQSAGELASALELAARASQAAAQEAAAPAPVAAAPPPAQRRLHRPVAWAAIGLLALLLVSGLVLVTLLRVNRASPQATSRGTASPPAEIAAPLAAALPSAEAPADTALPPLSMRLTEWTGGWPPIGPENARQVSGVHSLNGHLQQVRSVAFAPDGQTLASAAEDRTVRLWRVSDGAMLKSMEGHTAAVNDVAFSPDGQTVGSASQDLTVRLWRASDGAMVRELKHPTGVLTVAFSPDGRHLASGALDNAVRLWRVADGQLLFTLSHESPVLDVTFAPDGQTLASSEASSGIVRLWRVSDGMPVRAWADHSSDVMSIAFSPDGRLLASAGSGDNSVRLWRLDDASPPRVLAHPTGVVTVAFAPNGKILATGSSDNTLRLWRVNDGALLVMLNEGVTVTPPTVQPPTSEPMFKVQMHQTQPGAGPSPKQGPALPGRALAFSPSGTAFASIAGDNTVRLWAVH